MRAVWCAAAVLLTGTAFADDKPGVPAARVDKLSKGANVCLWFRYVPDKDREKHFRNYLTAADAKLMRDLGLKHVRLCLHPAVVTTADDPTKPDEAVLRHVAAAVELFRTHDLAVILDLHAEHNQKRNDVEKELLGTDDGVAKFAAFWTAFASRFADTDPDWVFFEVLNEPVFDKNQTRWEQVREKLLAAVRKVAPKHTVIVAGHAWSGVWGLQQAKPAADPNVVYTFHFYDPFVFTHQGATWTGDAAVPKLKGVPYPADAERITKAIDAQPDEATKAKVRQYGKEGWDAAKLARQVKAAADWRAKHQVPVFVGEFGVYPVAASGQDREKWFQDVAKAFADAGFGWTVWGYDDAFGLRVKKDKDGKPTVDAAVAAGLGLKAK
jgi:aryl-phospho-beta-D-glucosidase BglC (GH1 family)